MDIILIILSIPIKLLFFGFFVCDLLKAIRETENKRTKIFLFCCATLISVVYNGIIFGIVAAITESNRKKGRRALIIVLGLVFIPFLVFIIRQILQDCFGEESENKKWKTRIADNFGFVTTQKSTLQALENPSPSTAVPVGNILDGIFDDDDNDDDEEKKINIKAFETQKTKSSIGHKKSENYRLDEILDRVFDEDKDKSIKLRNFLEEEENISHFDTNHVFKGVVNIEDEKELSEIKVV